MEESNLLVKKFAEIWELLKRESVRGSVIVACAFIEDQLEELLKSRLIVCEKKKDYLFDGANAPIGSMASKIDLAFRTGCIGAKNRESLHILRKLRNDFAHLSSNINFETQSVKDRTERLLFLNREFVELAWGGLRSDMYSALGIENPPAYSDLFTDMLKSAGYRTTFEIWASAMAGVLAEESAEMNRLEWRENIT